MIDTRPATPPSALRAALLRLDLRLRLAVEGLRGELVERARDPFRGLYISEADVDELLASAPADELTERLRDSPVGVDNPRLQRLAELFDLDSFEQETLLVCLAPDVDLRYERLYAYLQDDVTRRRPTVELILRLLAPSLEQRARARAAFSPSGRLLGRGLLSVIGDEAAGQASLLARPLRLDERLVEYLLGSDRLDARAAVYARLFEPEGGAPPWVLSAQLEAGLVSLLREPATPADNHSGPLIYLHGPAGSAKRATLRSAAAAAGRPLLLVDMPTLLATSSERAQAATFGAVAREALLQDAVLGLDGFDSLLADEPEARSSRTLLRRVLADQPGPIVLLGDERWEPSLWLEGRVAVRLELPVLGVGDRLQLWRSQLDGQLAPADMVELAGRYRLVEHDAIRAVAIEATSRAALRGSAQVSADDFRSAARSIATPPLKGLARHVEPRYTWNDIVLPTDGILQLREVCARLRHQGTVLEEWGYGRKHARRSGITALFAGAPGTGKTMAAEIVAGDLGLDLYRIDLSAVVSKYIGETEKNLERIFTAADQGEAVLLFDEADAIFGKRSEVRDARDRYANLEVAYLLQRLEAYDGLAVLTTNLRGNIDEAFIRRLDFVLEFPVPEEDERLRIWRLALPSEAPLDEDVDLAFLARKFKLAGGHIRNIALTSAFLAAEDGRSIGMRHMARAIRREYQKLGKLVAEADFEHYYAVLKDQ